MSGLWRTSGRALLQRDPDGRLAVTDDWLCAYLLRPELRPIDESCDAERALHAALLDDPRRPITPVALVALRDPDARENYDVFARFRDCLLAHGTLEAAYLAFARGRAPALPALFLDHVVHAILHGILEDDPDPFCCRAAELLFRPQKASVAEGTPRLADADTLDLRKGAGPGLLQLAAEAGGDTFDVTLDVLTPATAPAYLDRSDRFDFVLDLAFGGEGLDALARVLERWVAHVLGVQTRIQPTGSIRDQRWSWHTGLDPASSDILNRLYDGKDVAEHEIARIVALFRLDFAEPVPVLPSMTGKPVYLGLATTAAGDVRFKPQNLLANLPLSTPT